MKRFSTIINMLVAWLMLGLAMTACSDNNPTLDDATINQVAVNSQRPDTPKTYQLTVNATKDEGITRALTLSGSSINASWETTDIVLVYRSGSETSIGTLKPESSGEATMLSGEVTTSGLTVGEELTLKFLSPDYKTQDGTLASIATKCDYATATIKIFAIDGEDKIMTEGAVFENQQSIVHFNFTDLVTNSDIKLKKFTISSTSLDSSISVELANEASEAYVAIPISTNDLVLYFDAKSEVNKIRYQGIKTASNLTNGKFYQANVKLDTPLTLEATNNNNTSTILIDNLLHKKIKYSVNGNDLQTSEDNSITITVNANDKVQFFGNNSSYAGDLKFSSCTFDFYIYGNVMSLIDESNYPELKEVNEKAFIRLFQMNSNIKNHPSKKLRLPATTLAAGCYSEMFYGTGLTTAPELPAETLANDCYSYMFASTGLTLVPELPATKLAEACYTGMFYDCKSLTSIPNNLLPVTELAEWCYSCMFSGCTSLTSIPNNLLPATKLADECYSEMFKDCTSLKNMPNLPATTLAESCYDSMFDGCTSLTSIPNNLLPATKLAESCYLSMFQGCTSLTSIPNNLLPATELANNCYLSMFEGCTSLETAPDLPAVTLKLRCYSSMFNDCSKLKSVKCLAINNITLSNTVQWLDGVSESGDFYGAPNMENTWRAAGGLPTNWTYHVVNP